MTSDPAALARPEIRALQPYASARATADSAGILLNANENPFPGDDDPAVNRYPDPQPALLRLRMANYYGVDEARILITRGSDEGIDLLTRVFCRPGRDRVLITPPCFGMYAIAARIQGAEIERVNLVPVSRGFELDTAGVAAADPCRLYHFCTPNNPTGSVLDTDWLETFADRVAGHGLVVVDEAYREFEPDTPSLAPAVAGHPNLVVLRTLSKAFALAGCRIGAVIADPAVIDLLRRVIAPYPLPTPAVIRAERALSKTGIARMREQVATLREEKRRLIAGLAGHPAVRDLWPGAANFVLMRVDDGPGLVRAATGAGIRLRDVSGQPGLHDAVRVTVGTPEENRILLDFMDGHLT